MAVIADKIILFLICCFSLAFIPVNTDTVISILIAISISALCYYFKSSKVTSFLFILYGTFCIANPLFCIFLPLLLYDVTFFQLKYLAAAAFFILIPYWSGNDVFHIGINVLGIVLAVIMQYRTKRHTKLQEEYKRLRDTSQELNLYLSNKNKMLIENQDYEIHLAMLKERNRIAREIHDNVGHMLSRSLLQVGALLAVCKDEMLSESLLSLKDTLNMAMNSIRESVHGLHEDSIDLQASIKSLTEEFPDYKIKFDYDMSGFVPKEIKYCFIMIIKEALTNTAKHSDADRIDIGVREHPVFYQLLIKDNGSGKTKKKEGGMGLENMNARVMSLNGNISMEEDAKGFKIFVSIPKTKEKQEG
ncbi:sensor histidine kinase [Konateibacter massiliensis]|uniref:sensor histidine kinase n=1 Tax=Konateibacter massiliensis TaxID=2002841 RepID=UPI000C150361|nr:histidine kinase [Konateibacter massiliensis]